MDPNQNVIAEIPRIVKRDRPSEQLPAVQSGDAINALVARVLADPSFPVERIQQILEAKIRWDEMQERAERNEARKAFVADMAEFKKNPPVITKNKHVGFDSRRTGQTTEYDHATHYEVTHKIIAGLAQHGFSHRWVTTQPNNMVSVECIITHRLGYSESFAMVAPPDTSGNKSAVQAIASTKTLLERYTLLGATGLSTMDLPDADDRKTGDEDDRPPLAEDVKNALKDASKEGAEALAKCFKGLSEQTRGRIVADYSEEWHNLKADAAKVKVTP